MPLQHSREVGGSKGCLAPRGAPCRMLPILVHLYSQVCGKRKLFCTETEMFLDAFCRYLATHLGWQDSGPRPGCKALLDGFLVRAVNSDPSSTSEKWVEARDASYRELRRPGHDGSILHPMLEERPVKGKGIFLESFQMQ